MMTAFLRRLSRRRSRRCTDCGSESDLKRGHVHEATCIHLLDGADVWLDVGGQGRYFLGSIIPPEGPMCWPLGLSIFLGETANLIRAEHDADPVCGVHTPRRRAHA